MFVGCIVLGRVDCIVGKRGRHEAQAPSNQVKNYKQIWHWVPNEVVSRSVWSISSVYWPAPLLGHRPSWSSACLFKVSMSRIIEQMGTIHIFREGTLNQHKSALWLSWPWVVHMSRLLQSHTSATHVHNQLYIISTK